MPFSFTLSVDPIQAVDDSDEIELNGEDIFLRGGEMGENASGDLATVIGVAAAKQSVLRELPANPGSFPRRPGWGGGLSGLLFKGASSSTQNRMQSRAKTRLDVNPRIFKVHEVSTSVESDGVRLTVRCDALGGLINEVTLIRPPGVS